MPEKKLYLVGKFAKLFVNSKITPVIILVSILLGFFSLLILPREEEPQIIVPMIDVFVEMPGAAPKEVSERVIKPMEALVKEISGVEYVYSTAMPGQALMIVRFYVGSNTEDSLIKLYNKLYSNFDKIPPNVSKPLIKPRSINDVPILIFTLWGKNYSGYELRQMALQLKEAIDQTPNVSETSVVGGYKKQLTIELIPEKLAAYKLDPNILYETISNYNKSLYLDKIDKENLSFPLKLEGTVSSESEAKNIVVAAVNNKPVYLKNVANVQLGPETVDKYVFYKEKGEPQTEAVTITVAKQEGKNATIVADEVIHKLTEIRKDFIPSDVEISITRNHGATAAERTNELFIHMIVAILSVTALIWVFLGKRESLVVAVAIPTTLALTMATFALYGFTLNRVTFFALIFSIGILVDDAIVVVENIVRHMHLPENKGRPLIEIAIEATDEIGNPTIFATIAVIAAILPMAFVGGLMGPYMRPIPVGASSAMIFSMLIAFVVIPWTAVRLLNKGKTKHQVDSDTKEDYLTSSYRRTMDKLIYKDKYRRLFLGGIILLCGLACSLVLFKLVIIKMLPFDNKNDFQIIVDTKEGTTLETTTQVAQSVADEVIKLKEVDNYQIYAGTAAPYNFNGLVRHYYLREGRNVADVQVNLVHKSERFKQSHEIAQSLRPIIDQIEKKYNANIKIAEVPPGPPVLQTLVVEVYGPDYNKQIELARNIEKIFVQEPGVVDVDIYMEDPHPQLTFKINHQKAKNSFISIPQITSALAIAFNGQVTGLLHDQNALEPVPLLMQLPEKYKPDLVNLMVDMFDFKFFPLKLVNENGKLVPIQSLVNLLYEDAPNSVYHKNSLPVVYVTADVAGEVESPVYAMLDLMDNIKVKQFFTKQPPLLNEYSVKWDGEWEITYQVFKDLAIAFAIVLVLIYALAVGWFQSFKTPLIIMSAIPFSLIGILPAHMLFGAFFTATSMIGFIAGAGIVVRNSIILVDFIELRLNEGMTLSEAVIDAGAVRFKPMMLTAAALVVGSIVILFDPIFQGLAISLMAGEVASLFLSRTAVPVLYYTFNRKDFVNKQLLPARDDVSILPEILTGDSRL